MYGRRETVEQDGTGDNPIYCPAASVAKGRTRTRTGKKGTLLSLSSLSPERRGEDHFVRRRRRSHLDFLLIEWKGNEENAFL